MLDQLTVDDFKGAIGQSFALQADDEATLDLELIEASTLDAGVPSKDGKGVRNPFQIMFRGPADPIAPQRIYELENDGVGTLEIFLVPVGQDAAGVRYQAVFS